MKRATARRGLELASPKARLANSRTVRLRSADRAEVIAAGRPCDRIEFAAEADLTGCIRRRSTAAGMERDERCEAALPWWEIDGRPRCGIIARQSAARAEGPPRHS